MRIDVDTKTGNPSIPVDQLMLFFDNKIRGDCRPGGAAAGKGVAVMMTWIETARLEAYCRDYLNPELFERHEGTHKELLGWLGQGDTVVVGQTRWPDKVQVLRNVAVGFENGCYTIDQRPDRLPWPHYLRIEPEDDYGWRLIAVFKPRQGQDGKTLA